MRIERIPENEKNAYAQLQIMNGTKKMSANVPLPECVTEVL